MTVRVSDFCFYYQIVDFIVFPNSWGSDRVIRTNSRGTIFTFFNYKYQKNLKFKIVKLPIYRLGVFEPKTEIITKNKLFVDINPWSNCFLVSGDFLKKFLINKEGVQFEFGSLLNYIWFKLYFFSIYEAKPISTVGEPLMFEMEM